MRDAFSYAAGDKAKLEGCRMHYAEDGSQILEFDISYSGGKHTIVDSMPREAKQHHLAAKAVQLGTRVREGINSGLPPHEWGSKDISANVNSAIDQAVEKIQSGQYEMVHDLAHTDPVDPTPPVFF